MLHYLQAILKLSLALEFFQYPRRHADRRIGQRVGERLRLGALDHLVGGLAFATLFIGLQPCQLFGIGRVAAGRDIGPQAEHVEVDGGQRSGMVERQP